MQHPLFTGPQEHFLSPLFWRDVGQSSRLIHLPGLTTPLQQLARQWDQFAQECDGHPLQMSEGE